MKQTVMIRAWEIARAGQKQFGGKVSEYFSEALKMSWKIEKQKDVKVDRLTIVTFNHDTQTADFEVQKYGRTIKVVKNVHQQDVNGMLAELTALYPTIDYYMIKDSVKHYRGRHQTKEVA